MLYLYDSDTVKSDTSQHIAVGRRSPKMISLYLAVVITLAL